MNYICVMHDHCWHHSIAASDCLWMSHGAIDRPRMAVLNFDIGINYVSQYNGIMANLWMCHGVINWLRMPVYNFDIDITYMLRVTTVGITVLQHHVTTVVITELQHRIAFGCLMEL